MAANLQLAPAAAGKRPGAAVVGWLPPLVVAGVEARTGKTPANLLMGIRSADNELRIRLVDGRDFQLDRRVLLGRNPVGQSGGQHAQLLAVEDPGRSISKTHLHLLTGGAGMWVTGRNSTNGSAASTPKPGSSAHFGDRTFHLGQA